MEELWAYKNPGVELEPLPLRRSLSPGRRVADEQSWCDTSHLSHPTEWDPATEEQGVDSPRGSYELELCATWQQEQGALLHSGWLLKAYGSGPQRKWRRRYAYLTPDRLCYTGDPGGGGALRYIPLDRIPVRALPRGYGPKVGVALVEDRQLDRSDPQFSPKKGGCVLSVACGSHTHFWAAPSPHAAKEWVEAITSAWVRCVKHAARSTHFPSMEEVVALKEAHWRAQNDALRQSLAEAEQLRGAAEGEAWRAREAAATAAQRAQRAEVAAPAPELPLAAVYEIQVVTGACEGAGTTSRVYVEVSGERESSGEHRLLYRGSTQAPFQSGAVDTFRLQCRPLGPLAKVRVYHNNTGSCPAWFLEAVRVRPQGQQQWTTFPCGRWLAVAKGDGRVMRELCCMTSEQQLAAHAEEAQLALQPAAPAAERTSQASWYSVVVCTLDAEGAGLTPGAAVFVALHGARGSSQRVRLPAQPGDFQRGQEDMFRVQLPGVGPLERLAVAISSPGAEAGWGLEQVEVTEEATGEVWYFPCPCPLSKAKGAGEAALPATRSDPRELGRLREQAQAARGRLAEAQAELAAARSRGEAAEAARESAVSEAHGRLGQAEAELQRAREALAAAQQAGAAAEGRVRELQQAAAGAAERAAALQRERDASAAGADASGSRAAQLDAELQALRQQLGAAQEAAAAAAARAGRYEAAALRSEEALHDVQAEQGRQRLRTSTRQDSVTGELQQLRAQVAAREGEAREARAAEREAAEECDRLARQLATERLRLKAEVDAAQQQSTANAAAAAAAAAAAQQKPGVGAAAQRQATYQLRVITSGGVPEAGTALPVQVELLGSRGSSGRITLQGGGSAPGTAQVFRVEAGDAGEPQQLRVWLEPPAGGSHTARWHLDSVQVQQVPEGGGGGGKIGGGASDVRPTACFCFCGWLDASNGHSVLLAASAAGVARRDAPPGPQLVRYRCRLEVAEVQGRPAPGSLQLTLFGRHGESGLQRLDVGRSGGSGAASPVVCTFEAPSVGQMLRCRVGLGSEGPPCSLLLPRVEVVNTASGECATFFCAERLSSEDPYDLELDATGEKGQVQGCVYRVELQTSSLRGAGTTGSVFLTFIGSLCTAGPYQLSNAAGEHFQRGQLDVFEVAGAPDVGALRQVEVRHDGAGKRNGWHLAWVKVANHTTGAVALFKCGRWIDRRSGEDAQVVAVVGALPPARGEAPLPPPHGLKDRLLLLGKQAAADGVRGQAPLAVGGGGEDGRGAAGEAGPGYRLMFHTSRICGSGTHAKVSFELCGSRGSSGVLQPVGGPQAFGSGRCDVFEWPQLPWLGQLQALRVGTDGTGIFPAWHLRMVEVVHLPTGRCHTFPCYNWVDKSCNYSRWLPLDLTVADSGAAAAIANAARKLAGLIPVSGGGLHAEDFSYDPGSPLAEGISATHFSPPFSPMRKSHAALPAGGGWGPLRPGSAEGQWSGQPPPLHMADGPAAYGRHPASPRIGAAR